jgi:hypothetical protein
MIVNFGVPYFFYRHWWLRRASATLASTVAGPAFTEQGQVVVPIVRVAVEPAHPQDMAVLVHGL